MRKLYSRGKIRGATIENEGSFFGTLCVTGSSGVCHKLNLQGFPFIVEVTRDFVRVGMRKSKEIVTYGLNRDTLTVISREPMPASSHRTGMETGTESDDLKSMAEDIRASLRAFRDD